MSSSPGTTGEEERQQQQESILLDTPTSETAEDAPTGTKDDTNQMSMEEDQSEHHFPRHQRQKKRHRPNRKTLYDDDDDDDDDSSSEQDYHFPNDEDDYGGEGVSLSALKHKILGRQVQTNDNDHETKISDRPSDPSSATTPTTSTTTDTTTMDNSQLQSELTCPICHEILYRPVTVPCGHSFCHGCLLWWWEHATRTPTTATIVPCPTCRSDIMGDRRGQDAHDDNDMYLDGSLPFQVNTALQAILQTQFPIPYAQRARAAALAEQRATAGEDGGKHNRGYEILCEAQTDTWKNLSMTYTINTSSGNRMDLDLRMRRSVVLDDQDQRMQLALCLYQNDNNDHNEAIVAWQEANDHIYLSVTLCLATMEEDEVEDSGFPDLIKAQSDQDHLRVQDSTRFSVPVEVMAQTTSSTRTMIGKDKDENTAVDTMAPVTRQVLGDDGIVTFDIHLSTEQLENPKATLVFRHTETQAELHLCWNQPEPGKGTTTESHSKQTAAATSGRDNNKKHSSRRFLAHQDDDSDEAEGDDDMDGSEQDSFIVDDDQDDDNRDDDEDEDENNDHCHICRDGGELMVCDGGKHTKGCGKSFHIECVQRVQIPDGDWICQECANDLGMRDDDVGIQGYEFPVMKMDKDNNGCYESQRTVPKEEEGKGRDLDSDSDDSILADPGLTRPPGSPTGITPNESDSEDGDSVALAVARAVASRRSTRVAKTAKSFDSDSDDSLLAEAGFGRGRPKRATKKEREQECKRLKQNLLVDSAFESAHRSYHSSIALMRMQSQNSESMHDDELEKRCKEAAESVRKRVPFSVDDITNGMEDHLDDGAHDAITKNRLAQALDTEGSVNFGLRATIRFDPMSHCDTVHFFVDKEQATMEFISILKESKTCKTKCGALLKKLSQVSDPQGYLVNLLVLGGPVSRLMIRDDNVEFSCSMAKWLFRIACSANVSDYLSQTATTLLGYLLEKKKLSDKAVGSFDEVGHLLAWCDTDKWPLCSSLDGGKEHKKDERDNDEVVRNLGGLINLITLWTVSLEASSIQDKVATDDASLALKLLFFIGIDPKVVSSNYSIKLQSSIRALIRLVIGKLEQSLESGASQFECARCLSMEILGHLSNEIKTLRKNKNFGESTALLTFPAVIRAAPLPNPNIATPELLSAMLCEMTVHALSAMGLSEAISSQSSFSCVPESTRETFASLPEPSRKAFAAAIASVETMLEWGSDVVNNAPQALAMTECATQAVRSGLNLLQFPYSKDQKEAIASVLDRMDEQVSKFTRRMRAVGHNDFLRHLDNIWGVHRQYVHDLYTRMTTKRSSTDMASSSTPKQQTLKSFLPAADTP